MKNKVKLNGKIDILQWLYKYGIIFAIVVMVAIFAATTNGNFISPANILNIFRAMSITTVIALGITFSVAVDGFDLSAGSTASLTSVFVGSMFVWYDMDIVPAIIYTVLISAVVGMFNAFIIIKLKIPDMLATLASMFIVAGIAEFYTSGKIVSINMIMPNGDTATGTIPAAFSKIGQAPTIIIIMLVVLTFAFIFLNFTKYGRYLYTIGGNETAAELSGVRVNRYKTIAYILSALLAGIGGILLTSRMAQANPASGAGYLMEGVAATFIGQSFLGNGKANAIGTFLGCLLMTALANGLVMNSIDYYATDIVKGAVLVLALAITYTNKK